MLRGMKKRIAATLLWFYAGWYAGAMVSELFGIPAILGPILGTAFAAFIGGDPRGIIWSTRPVAESEPGAQIPTQAPQPTI